MTILQDKKFGGSLIGCVTVVLSIILFFLLQSTQEFSYFYREQQQIFLFDSEYIHQLIRFPGGIVAVCSQFLVQFFVLSKMGALISCLVSAITIVFLALSLRNFNKSLYWLPFAFLPVYLFNLCLADNYVHYDGLVAWTFLSFFFYLYTCLRNQSLYIRLALGSLSAIVLYFAAGAIATIFGISVLLIEIFINRSKCYYFVLPLMGALLAGLVCYNQALISSMEHIYSMKDYVEYYFEPTVFYSLSWYIWILLLLVVLLTSKFEGKKMGLQLACCILGVILLPLGYQTLNKKHQDAQMYSLEKVSYYANQENWEKVIYEAQGETNNYLMLNYLNLAYSKKGELLEHLFTIPQSGSQSLVMDYQQYTDVSLLMAKIYDHIGVVSMALNQAFSGNMSVTYGNPALTKLMVKNYIINGQYGMAEKHISRLERSWYYADWAHDQRKFLDNDKVVNADPEYGSKRKDLPQNNDEFAMLNGPIYDAIKVFETNPNEKNAADYAIGMMLLNKNFDSIKLFVERNYGKGCLKELPECLQEAVINYAETDMDYCRAHGVSEQTIQRFANFRRAVLTIRHSGGSLNQLARDFGNSFWYYSLKTQKRS